MTITAHFCCPSNLIHATFYFLTIILSTRKRVNFKWNYFLNANMHTPRILIQKYVYFWQPPLQIERSRYFYFNTASICIVGFLLSSYWYEEKPFAATLNIEDLLKWMIYSFSRKKSAYSSLASWEVWFLVFLSLQTPNTERLRYFLLLSVVVMLY